MCTAVITIGLGIVQSNRLETDVCSCEETGALFERQHSRLEERFHVYRAKSRGGEQSLGDLGLLGMSRRLREFGGLCRVREPGVSEVPPIEKPGSGPMQQVLQLNCRGEPGVLRKH